MNYQFFQTTKEQNREKYAMDEIIAFANCPPVFYFVGLKEMVGVYHFYHGSFPQLTELLGL